jgi:hypothetical protein
MERSAKNSLQVLRFAYQQIAANRRDQETVI